MANFDCEFGLRRFWLMGSTSISAVYGPELLGPDELGRAWELLPELRG